MYGLAPDLLDTLIITQQWTKSIVELDIFSKRNVHNKSKNQAVTQNLNFRGSPFIMADKNKDKATLWTIQRSYEFDTHDENHNVINNISEAQWRKKIQDEMQQHVKSGDVVGMRGIFHDSDTSEGVLKGLHFHAILKMKSRRYMKPLIKMFEISSEGNIDIVKDLPDATRYLLHISKGAINDGKHIYSESDLIEMGQVKDFHEIIKEEKHAGITFKKVDELYYKVSAEVMKHGLPKQDVLEWILKEVNGDEIAQRYIWLKYRSDYKRDIEEYVADKAEKLSQDGRNMQTFYIEGHGGSGKSVLAQGIAKVIDSKRAPFKAAGAGKGKTFDFTDGYVSQPVGILDDVIGPNFELGEFLQNFDPYVFSLTASRTKNTHYLADYTILNSSVTLKDFVTRLMKYSKGGSEFTPVYGNAIMKDNEELNTNPKTVDRYFQSMRRMKFNIVIKNNRVSMWRFVEIDSDTGEFEHEEILHNMEYRPRKKDSVAKVSAKIVELMKQYD